MPPAFPSEDFSILLVHPQRIQTFSQWLQKRFNLSDVPSAEAVAKILDDQKGGLVRLLHGDQEISNARRSKLYNHAQKLRDELRKLMQGLPQITSTQEHADGVSTERIKLIRAEEVVQPPSYMRNWLITHFLQGMNQFHVSGLNANVLVELAQTLPMDERDSWIETVHLCRTQVSQWSQELSPMIPLMKHLNIWFLKRGCMVIPKVNQTPQGTVVRLHPSNVQMAQTFSSPLDSPKEIEAYSVSRVDQRLPRMQSHASHILGAACIDADEVQESLDTIKIFATERNARYPTEPERYTKAEHAYARNLWKRYPNPEQLKKVYFSMVLVEELRHFIDCERLPFDIHAGKCNITDIKCAFSSLFQHSQQSQLHQLFNGSHFKDQSVDYGKVFNSALEVTGKLTAAAMSEDSVVALLDWKRGIERHLAFRPRYRTIKADLSDRQNLPIGMWNGGHEVAFSINAALLSNELIPQISAQPLPIAADHPYDHEDLVRKLDHLATLPQDVLQKALKRISDRELILPIDSKPFSAIQ